ncbi:MAG TPA: light-harvesting antenna LH1, beta subunit [Myxococcales bacterium LLY-WYZ-16_1]|jgi:light-harvesting complex 1 beta chain|nr:light-harvesting antenna LH1, beta subunit [Myxococcales bacterium LLY-WYZ-16_1]
MAEGTSIFSQSGLSEAEAKEVHGYFVQWFAIYLLFAIVAHLLVFFWRPWIQPGEPTSMIDGASTVVQTAMTMLV